MSIDYSAFKFDKGQPRESQKRVRKAEVVSFDAMQSRLVKIRSGGRCEIAVLKDGVAIRCPKRASEVHHMLGGVGRRGKHESARAVRKQHCCQTCHRDITTHLLQHIGPQMPRWTDKYRRVQ